MKRNFIDEKDEKPIQMIKPNPEGWTVAMTVTSLVVVILIVAAAVYSYPASEMAKLPSRANYQSTTSR